MADALESPAKQSEIADTLVSGERACVALPRGTAVGRYLVLSLLGEGGMGTVHAAYDPDLDRKVAIKLLKLTGDDQEIARTMLLREAQAMARVSHPNVLAVFEAGPFGEQLFLAMELVEGVTLADWLRERKRDRDEILQAFSSAGEGLAAAHAAGLVHRDFKPENVLVGRDGRVRVTDFGLAHVEAREVPVPVPAVGDASQSGVSLGGRHAGSGPTLVGAGTPAYMSPEQLAGAPSDARSDQFSFCVALWEALCGERPFGGRNLEEIRAKVLLAVAPVPPRSWPAPVRTALSRGLARRPEDRFASLADLLPLLHRRPRRRAVRLGIAAALLGVVGGAVSLAVWRHHRETTRCAREAGAALEQLWNAPRREGLRATLGKAGFTEQQVGEALGAMDADLRGWGAARREACEAARVSGAPDAHAERCLARRALRSDTALALLAEPATDVRTYLGVALERLHQPLGCLERPARPAPVPDAEMRRLEAAAERMRLLEEMGHSAQAVQEGPAYVEQARAAGAWAQLAAMEYTLASAIWSVRGPNDAEVLTLLRRSVLDADVSGDDEVSLAARMRMVHLLVIGQGKPAEAVPWVESMNAWLRRIGSPPAKEIEILQASAALESALDHGEAAVALYRRSLVLAERLFSKDVAWATDIHNDLGTELARQGRHREALAEFRASAECLANAKFVSPAELALAWANAGLAHLYLGDPRAAAGEFERARAVLQPVRAQIPAYATWLEVMDAGARVDLGEVERAGEVVTRALEAREALDNGALMDALNTKAKVLVVRGRPAEAVPLAEESLVLAERSGELAFAALVRFTLARALWDAHHDRPRALELARAARDRLAGPDNEVMRGRVEAWLAGAVEAKQ